MKKIKVYRVSRLEEEIEELGWGRSQARVLGAVVRDIMGVISRQEDRDTAKFCINGTVYELTINKEQL